MTLRRIPNEFLRALLSEAAWTGEALAREVNAIGAEAGLNLCYQRSSTAHWLSGIQPRQPVPELIAEAFSRRLGRRVTSGEAGFDRSRGKLPVSGVWWQEDVVTRLIELAGDGQRREAVAGCVYSLALLAVPGWADLSVAVGPGRRQDEAITKVGSAEVDAAALMLGVFADADKVFGGGHARRAVAGYLATAIGPWLRADASPAVRRRLLVVAAQLTYLSGFMCFDSELHGAAQRYYLLSLRLAGEAGEITCYANALRQLSVQAWLLGHRRPAVHLAEAAVESVSRAQDSAFLVGQLAVAAAAAGDRRTALASLRTAELGLRRSGRTVAATGAYHSASLAHQRAEVLQSLGNGPGAVSALEDAISCRPPDERRSRALMLGRLGELQLGAGQLERACESWQRFLDDYPNLRSGRVDRAFAVLRASTVSYRNNAVVEALRHRAAEVGSAGRRA